MHTERFQQRTLGAAVAHELIAALSAPGPRAARRSRHSKLHPPRATSSDPRPSAPIAADNCTDILLSPHPHSRIQHPHFKASPGLHRGSQARPALTRHPAMKKRVWKRYPLPWVVGLCALSFLLGRVNQQYSLAPSFEGKVRSQQRALCSPCAQHMLLPSCSHVLPWGPGSCREAPSTAGVHVQQASARLNKHQHISTSAPAARQALACPDLRP